MAGYAEHEDSAAADALWAAITGEPLPEGARDDPEAVAEHRSAVADLVVLREQLAAIGGALAEAGEETRPVRVPRQRPRRPAGAPRNRGRRPLAVVLGTLAAAVVASMVVGMGWLIAQGGGVDSKSSADSGAKAADSASGSASLSGPGYLACSRLLAEGEIAGIEPVPGTGRDRVTLDVTRSYKPAKGKTRVTFLVDREEAAPRRGEHVLVGIRRGAVTPDRWTTGEKDIARDREWILRALPASRSLTCE
ncbi:hypothetical protein AB0M86_31415 [Streptomyces sp. NPDC051639]|uniref:hypothetical protein n=1 Tax=unclassified Streptomyces TaxID=2593676 RepID=UPI00143E7E66|nr:hypothetical protein [Streptomyces sp. RPA4-2]QIY62671.1 hypothetical protein HEP85_14615 [Streptomyces sp. RPA4-2]